MVLVGYRHTIVSVLAFLKRAKFCLPIMSTKLVCLKWMCPQVEDKLEAKHPAASLGVKKEMKFESSPAL